MSKLREELGNLVKLGFFVFLILVSAVGFFNSLNAASLFLKTGDPLELWIPLITFIAMVLLLYLSLDRKTKTDGPAEKVRGFEIFTAPISDEIRVAKLKNSVSEIITKHSNAVIKTQLGGERATKLMVTVEWTQTVEREQELGLNQLHAPFNFSCTDEDTDFLYNMRFTGDHPIILCLDDGSRLELIIKQLSAKGTTLLFKAVSVNSGDCYSGSLDYNCTFGQITVVDKEKLEW